MKMRDCPKFHTCNAPICPLDQDWKLRSHHDNDHVCFYMIESVKDISRTHFHGEQLEHMLNRIDLLRDEITNKHSRIKRQLERSSKSKSTMLGRFK